MSTFIPEITGPGRVPPAVTKERLKPSGWANAFLITKSVTGPMEASAPPMNGRIWAGRTICMTRRSCLWSARNGTLLKYFFQLSLTGKEHGLTNIIDDTKGRPVEKTYQLSYSDCMRQGGFSHKE